ncbi:class I SAM-dependent RNA methyltransferase [Rhodococcus sp. D2-41]|uniref:Class I SAM-dependent RNA methyltransferase n=1 Tax=Speluncibacter jeojiensis TaxID=2710754 RepID=A0A9X4M2H5_9ACTN|nr:class I SAM-dependent RNA methyltransferase [Rhodococcus sp. D2-41]MDG3011389.1 class I SAM-dependent RNA methyltransferase [Rhodococcus sp. D2-41]MDG3016599.1 class I SAM-dependent RNA methyltransferase [Corynebacteriales bacterium D3-21]
MTENWVGQTLELSVGNPGHGGFCVARHEGRVVFVRHTLPGERVRARVTEDRGGSFCRADAVEIIEAAAGRVRAVCPVSGPGGAGCCDFSHVDRSGQLQLKAAVVAEQLRRIAHLDRDVEVEELPGTGDGTRWRTRVRLAVGDDGRAGFHGYRATEVIADLRCPQMPASAYTDLADRTWQPGAEVQVVLDDDGNRHVVEIAPPRLSRTGRRDGGRRGAAARRAASAARRAESVVEGDGHPVQRVGERQWLVAATGFWQAHRGAATRYADLVGEWAAPQPGAHVWDLYGGVGVFAAALAGPVGQTGRIVSVESSGQAVADGGAALADLPQVDFRHGRVERLLAEHALGEPDVVVLDPPRSGAGREVVEPLCATGPERIVHIGCDPASFARDVALYAHGGYRLQELRVFDAFPMTHHMECVGLLTR